MIVFKGMTSKYFFNYGIFLCLVLVFFFFFFFEVWVPPRDKLIVFKGMTSTSFLNSGMLVCLSVQYHNGRATVFFFFLLFPET